MTTVNQRARGHSLVELSFAMGVAATLAGVAVPQLGGSIDAYRAAGAARYLSGRMQRARMEAVTRSREVALRFSADAGGYSFATYMDGNRNGVLTREIE